MTINSKIPLVVTRHRGLVDFLREDGFLEEIELTSHVRDPNILRGREVWGNLPMHLAAYADKVVCVDLDLPPEARGKDLTSDEVRKYCRSISTYRVERIGRMYMDED